MCGALLSVYFGTDNATILNIYSLTLISVSIGKPWKCRRVSGKSTPPSSHTTSTPLHPPFPVPPFSVPCSPFPVPRSPFPAPKPQRILNLFPNCSCKHVLQVESSLLCLRNTNDESAIINWHFHDLLNVALTLSDFSLLQPIELLQCIVHEVST